MTKMIVAIPPHIQKRRPELGVHCFVLCSGLWTGGHSWVEVMEKGADLVVELDQIQTRWMYPSRQAAHAALGRWSGEGEPPGLDMPDDLPTFTGAAP